MWHGLTSTRYPRYIVSPHPNAVQATPQLGDAAVRSTVNPPRDGPRIKLDILSPDTSAHLNSTTFEPSRPQVKSELDQIIFFGESSPLTCVVEEVSWASALPNKQWRTLLSNKFRTNKSGLFLRLERFHVGWSFRQEAEAGNLE